MPNTILRMETPKCVFGIDYVNINGQRIKFVPLPQDCDAIVLVIDHRFISSFEEEQADAGPAMYSVQMGSKLSQPAIFSMGMQEAIRKHSKLSTCMLDVRLVTTEYFEYVSVVTMDNTRVVRASSQDLCTHVGKMSDSVCEGFENWLKEVCVETHTVPFSTRGDASEIIHVNHAIVLHDQKYDEEIMEYSDCFDKPYK